MIKFNKHKKFTTICINTQVFNDSLYHISKYFHLLKRYTSVILKNSLGVLKYLVANLIIISTYKLFTFQINLMFSITKVFIIKINTKAYFLDVTKQS